MLESENRCGLRLASWSEWIGGRAMRVEGTESGAHATIVPTSLFNRLLHITIEIVPSFVIHVPMRVLLSIVTVIVNSV